jgi:predicted histone-like DNA-binding protein
VLIYLVIRCEEGLFFITWFLFITSYYASLIAINQKPFNMPQKFKVIERGQPGVSGGGPKKFYAMAVSDGEYTLEDITREIEKRCTVNGADILAVLYSMVDVSADALADGTIVRLGDLGSLRLSLSSEGREKEEDVTASAIRGSSIIFHPGPKLQATLLTMKYHKQ